MQKVESTVAMLDIGSLYGDSLMIRLFNDVIWTA
jgi:hypothetical protein